MTQPFNFEELMNQAKQMQDSMRQKAEEASKVRHKITVGGDMIEMEVNGKQEVLSVKIDPEAVDPNDVETLEDLVRSAFNEAIRRTSASSADSIGQVLKDFKIPGMP